jgi:hypothetical protein
MSEEFVEHLMRSISSGITFCNDTRRLRHLVVFGASEAGKSQVSRNDRKLEEECRYFRQKI